MSNRKTTPTEAQLAANRANAEHSTGPKTEEGKRIASHNALKTCLTGRTVLLPTDDLADYQAHLERIEARYEPATDEETLHAQTIAQIEWRLLRIPSLETGILALGRKRFAETHADEPADTRAILIEAEVHLAFQKPLANLALQESRLNRQHERETAKLEKLQSTRKAREAELLEEAARLYIAYEKDSDPFPLSDLEAFGFEFSLDDIQRAVAIRKGKSEAGWPTIQSHYLLHYMQAA